MVGLLLCMAAGAHAASHWSVNPHSYQYDMTVYATLNVGGKALADYSDYEVAVFCDKECRGVAKVRTASDGSKYLYLRVYSNVAADETIRFCVYQISKDKETWLAETVAFEAATMAGTPGEPMALVLSNVLKGDANGDGKVDIADALCIVDYLTGNPSAVSNAAAADVNGDGEITIADAVGVMNIIMDRSGASAPAMDMKE